MDWVTEVIITVIPDFRGLGITLLAAAGFFLLMLGMEAES